jgi:hypothetical protein
LQRDTPVLMIAAIAAAATYTLAPFLGGHQRAQSGAAPFLDHETTRIVAHEAPRCARRARISHHGHRL